MKLLALTGGVGGAKLALGLSKILGPETLAFAVNTGDDFQHLGLHISPDIDSLTYALAETNNERLGWGRAGETWQFIETLEALGGPGWFRLGDKDLALHMRRTELLQNGATLTEATATITRALGIEHAVLPMSNDTVATIVQTAQGPLPFQHYFVRERCQPQVTGFEFSGVESAQTNPALMEWLQDCDGVVICPSNPFVSVAPLLALDTLAQALQQLPIVAVSPIVGGLAIKGPAAKMMKELHMPSSAAAVADHYQGVNEGLINGFVIDQSDAQLAKEITIPTIVTNTIMVTLEDRIALARECIGFLEQLQPS